MGMNKNASFKHVALRIMAMAAFSFAGAADAADEVSPAEDVANWSDAEEFVADTLGKMKLGQDVDRATLDHVVDICESALDSAPEDTRAYPLFLKAARGLIDYSPDDIEGRLGVYYVQSRLVEKILGHQYEILGMSEQDVLRTNALLKDYMANVAGRIIPDYKPRPVYRYSGVNFAGPTTNRVLRFKLLSNSDYTGEWQVNNGYIEIEMDEEKNNNNLMLNNEQFYLGIQRQKFESWISRFIEETEGTGSHGAGGPRKSFEEEK